MSDELATPVGFESAAAGWKIQPIRNSTAWGFRAIELKAYVSEMIKMMFSHY